MELSKKSDKALKQWTADDFYIYIRPITSTYLNANEPHRVYWNVLVEYRTVGWKRWKATGLDLNDVLEKLADEIPRRKELEPKYVSAGKEGRPSKLGPYVPTGPLGLNDVIFTIENNEPPPAPRDPGRPEKKSKKSKKDKKDKKDKKKSKKGKK